MSQLMQILRPAIHKDIDEEYNLLKNDVRGNSARVETSRAPVKKTAPNEYNALLERLNQLEKKLNKKKTKKNDLIPKGGRKPNDVSRDKELALKLQKEYDEEAASPKKDAEQNVENPFTTILGNGKIPSRKLWSEYPSDN